MSTMIDIFNQDAFSAASLTQGIYQVPNTYGRLNQLGLFRPEPVATRAGIVVIENGVLNLLPTRPVGGPASLGTRGKQKPIPFYVLHIPHDDAVFASDVQNMLALGQINGGGLVNGVGLETVQGFLDRKLITMRNKHAITLENLRVGAIKGRILDSDGSVLLDLFQTFGATEQVFDFKFGTTGVGAVDVNGMCQSITGYMEDNLLGETMTGVQALCSPEFFRGLISSPNVKDAYKFYQAGLQPLRDDVRKGFRFGGIEFEEYRGAASYLQEDGTRSAAQRFIPAGDARFFPIGTTDTFVNYWCPPDFWGAVNQAPDAADAEVFVAPLEPMEFGKGMKIHTESNPLPFVKRPALLVRGTTST